MKKLYKISNECPLCKTEGNKLICTTCANDDEYFNKLKISNSHNIYSNWFLCYKCQGAYNTLRITPEGMSILYSTSITSMAIKNAMEKFEKVSSLNDSESETYLKAKWFVNNSSIFNNQSLNFLDFGCGMGIFQWNLVNKFATLPLNIYGIEPSTDYVDCCKKNLEGNFYCGSDKNLKIFNDNFFNLISSITVLEHLLDPLDNLIRLKQKLNKYGEFWLEIPSIRNFEILPISHDNFKCQHLFMHSKESIQFLLEKAGFFIRKISTQKSFRGKFMIKVIAKIKD
tara:strand:- start:1836 stop:2687 length:852 start_codon:yes stop_codon:yes gene_type:complete